MKNIDDFLKSCIAYFGKDKQQVVAIEEMAELTQQLSKFVIDHPKKSRENVVEEYTDVLIMLNQIRIIFEITDTEVEQIKTFKIGRLMRFMESRRTPLAPDAGDSAASIGIVHTAVITDNSDNKYAPIYPENQREFVAPTAAELTDPQRKDAL